MNQSSNNCFSRLSFPIQWMQISALPNQTQEGCHCASLFHISRMNSETSLLPAYFIHARDFKTSLKSLLIAPLCKSSVALLGIILKYKVNDSILQR